MSNELEFNWIQSHDDKWCWHCNWNGYYLEVDVWWARAERKYKWYEIFSRLYDKYFADGNDDPPILAFCYVCDKDNNIIRKKYDYHNNLDKVVPYSVKSAKKLCEITAMADAYRKECGNDDEDVCICTPDCKLQDSPCKGECGCLFCRKAYVDAQELNRG